MSHVFDSTEDPKTAEELYSVQRQDAPELYRQGKDTNSRQDDGLFVSPAHPSLDLPYDAEPASVAGDIPMDIRELLRALHTKDDSRPMLANLEETLRREIQDLRGEISPIQTRVEAVESASSAADNRITSQAERPTTYDAATHGRYGGPWPLE